MDYSTTQRLTHREELFDNLDPILFSDELETTFSDVMQVDRIKSDHDATIAFFPIPYDLQTNYKRDVWLYKHGNYDGLNSEIDQFDWNSHLSSLNDIDEMSVACNLNRCI